jgi:hypothetical protein
LKSSLKGFNFVTKLFVWIDLMFSLYLVNVCVWLIIFKFYILFAHLFNPPFLGVIWSIGLYLHCRTRFRLISVALIVFCLEELPSPEGSSAIRCTNYFWMTAIIFSIRLTILSSICCWPGLNEPISFSRCSNWWSVMSKLGSNNKLLRACV